MLSENRDEFIRLLRRQAASRTERLPLSSGQQSIWMLDRLAPGSSVNNLGTAVRISTPPDLPGTLAALQLLVDRHPMLRATFHVEDGTLVQHIAGMAAPAVALHDATALDDAGLRRIVDEEHQRPFDLEAGPLVRVALFDCGGAGHILLLATHHVISDALSMLVLLGELLTAWSELRGGPPAELPPLRAQYAEFVRAEADLLAGPEGESLWQNWREQLADLPPLLRLPADRARPDLPSFAGGSVPFVLPWDAAERLATLAREANTTLFTVLLATWSTFLARLTGATDLVVGTPMTVRGDENTYRVIGHYVNALPLRLRLRWRDTLRDTVAAHRTVVQQALDGRAFPIQQIINRLNPGRTGSGAPLFNCFFNFQQIHLHRDVAALAGGLGEGMEMGGVALHPFRLAQQPGQFDLTLNLSWFGNETSGSLDYSTDLFDAATAERLAADYVRFVEALAADPDDTLMPRAERARIAAEFNQTAAALPQDPFPAQFSASARRTPTRPAVRCGDQILDYATLDRASDALAARLRRHGAGRGTLVGVHMERSVTLVAALVAIAKAGAAFLPLDPAFPAARLAAMTADSGMELLLSDMGRPDWLADAVAVLDPAADGTAEDGPRFAGPDPADTAYVLYTSGSTGTPNGVRVPHRALANLLGAMLAVPGIRPTDVVAAVTTVSFDIAIFELFAPLLVGATIEVVPRQVATDGAQLAEELGRMGATLLQATPSTWRMLVEAGWRPPAGFRGLSGGEAMTRELATALLERGVELWNLYGPTETTIYSTGGQVLDPARVDVGRPVANTRVHVLDEAHDAVPIGVAGRVWIGGAGLADGYHGRPELTAQRFRVDGVVPGERVYDTGDVGHWTPDGRLALSGRADDQIKLRGVRIEPGEIEAVLSRHPDIRRAVIAARPVGDDLRLVAYVVHAPGTAPTSSELRRHVRRSLPEHMVPALFVGIPTVPLTPSGKTDRRRLPDPFAQEAGGAGREPRPGLEQTLARIWQEVLGVQHVWADDKFFEIGGHSLLALRMAAALERETGLRVPPIALFFQTLGQLAETLSGAKAA